MRNSLAPSALANQVACHDGCQAACHDGCQAACHDAESIQYPDTRREALAWGFSRYDTRKPCRNGHLALRIASSGACTTCQTQISRDRYQSIRGHTDPVLAARAKARNSLAKSHERRRKAREAADRAIRTPD